MIKVPDLCIGNWVYDGDRTQFPMWVQAIGDDYVYLNFEGSEADPWETTPEELQGIPLTEKLLEKIGFNKVTIIRWGKTEEDKIIEIVFWPNDKIQVQIRTLIYANQDSCNHWHIRYLHELQNLFWNITKQQLKIEL